MFALWKACRCVFNWGQTNMDSKLATSDKTKYRSSTHAVIRWLDCVHSCILTLICTILCMSSSTVYLLSFSPLSLSLSLSLALSLSVCVSLSVSLSVSVSLFLSLFLSVSHSISLSLPPLSPSPLSASYFLSLSASLSFSLPPLCLFLSVSLCLFVSLFVVLLVSVCLFSLWLKTSLHSSVVLTHLTLHWPRSKTLFYSINPPLWLVREDKREESKRHRTASGWLLMIALVSSGQTN